uniref:Uncharacterized protein n=1 Tax=Arion vulgaris TaxID=1028688 RepID=A0A0B7AGU9_9EUPU
MSTTVYAYYPTEHNYEGLYDKVVQKLACHSGGYGFKIGLIHIRNFFMRSLGFLLELRNFALCNTLSR